MFLRLLKTPHHINNAVRNREYCLDRIIAALLLKLEILLRINFKQHIKDTEEEITVVIPTVPKDITLLERVIESLTYVQHSISEIIIIAPNTSTTLMEFCQKRGLILLDESVVLPGILEEIHYAPQGRDRRGWLFQQFLKLKSAELVRTRFYLVLDSDTILVRPQHFYIKKKNHLKTILFKSLEWHKPYFDAYKRLFGQQPALRTSSIAHMMLFDREKVHEMLTEIEEKHRKSWIQAILQIVDLAESSCFSEYETYANWVYTKHPETVQRAPFYNHSLSRNMLTTLSQLTATFSHRYHSVSFHAYIK